MKPTFIQLGRIGDILNIIPALYARHGEFRLVVAKDYAHVLEGFSYIEPVIFDGDFRDVGKAMQFIKGAIPAQVMGNKAQVAQVYARGYQHGAFQMESFAKESWRLAGVEDLWREDIPLIIDKRNKEREEALIASELNGSKPFGLVFTTGHSSPIDFELGLIETVKARFPYSVIVNPRAEHILDLVALMERADFIVATDSAPLHLAQAVPEVPVIALIADKPSKWHGTAFRRNHIAYIRYGNILKEISLLTEAIKKSKAAQLKTGDVHVYPHHPTWTRFIANDKAKESWWSNWGHIGVRELPITDSHSNDEMPPTVEKAMRLACLCCQNEEGTIILTNDDTMMYPGVIGMIGAKVMQHGAVWAGRDDYEGDPEEKDGRTPDFKPYPGTDFFAFTVKWWRKHGPDYPTMRFGREAWDMVMRELMRLNGGQEITEPVCYHFRHKTKWESERLTDPANIANRKAARAWLRKKGLPLAELDFREPTDANWLNS